MTNPTTTSSPGIDSLAQALGFEPDDHVTVATHKVQRARTISAAELDFEYSAGLLDQQDTWIGAQPVKPALGDKRAKYGDVACVRVLYADFDRKDSTDEAQIDRAISQLSLILGVGPISVVDSGGGLHPRWKLEAPIAPEDAKGALKRWGITVQRVAQEYGFKADSVFDLPRVLRLPGTVNEKYDPPRPVSITERPFATVSTAAVWSKLDHASAKKSPLAELEHPNPAIDDEEFREAVSAVEPVAKPQLKQTLSERAVNSEVQRDLDRLERLSVNGWDGEPWHNTTRDVAYRLAKIARSPETTLDEEYLRGQFFRAAPQDDEGFDEDLLEKYWESGLERAAEDFAEGNAYELAGSGDDLFADDMDEMLAGIQAATEESLDAMSFESSVSSGDGEPQVSLEDLYAGLERPLVPGFGGRDALRGFPVPTDTSSRIAMRVQGLGDRISDLHAAEHDEYMHPHCRECFPDRWRVQLHRWVVLSPSKDPSEIRPPIGQLAPDEGYMWLGETDEMGEVDQLIDGYLPANSVGILNGRGSAGKTFVAVDMALAISDPNRMQWRTPLSVNGEETLGAVTDHGPVLFLAGESAPGVRDRMYAAIDHSGSDRAAMRREGRFMLRGEIPNLFTGGAAYDSLLKVVADIKPRLIIIDTLQKASAGAEANSASDMAIVHGRLAELKSATDGGSVMVIAHTDKSDTTTRGSSAIEDDADFVLHVEGRDKVRRMSVEKMRDGAPGPDYEFVVMSHAGSAVAVPVEEGVRDEGKALEDMKRVAYALDRAHGATSEDTMIKISEIKEHLDNMHPTLRSRAMAELKSRGYVSYGGGQTNTRTYRLTPAGRGWLQGQEMSVLVQGGRKI